MGIMQARRQEYGMQRLLVHVLKQYYSHAGKEAGRQGGRSMACKGFKDSSCTALGIHYDMLANTQSTRKKYQQLLQHADLLRRQFSRLRVQRGVVLTGVGIQPARRERERRERVSYVYMRERERCAC
jgi:hypothetical protein